MGAPGVTAVTGEHGSDQVGRRTAARTDRSRVGTATGWSPRVSIPGPLPDREEGPVDRDRIEQDDRSGRQLPPRLDPRAGRPARSPAGGRRSRAGARVLRGLGAVLSVLLLAGSGWGWYLTRVAEASVNRTDAIPTTGN